MKEETEDTHYLTQGNLLKQRARIGGIAAYSVAAKLNVDVLISFAAGNFIYIAAVDLIPEIKPRLNGHGMAMPTASFLTGMTILLLLHYAQH